MFGHSFRFSSITVFSSDLIILDVFEKSVIDTSEKSEMRQKSSDLCLKEVENPYLSLQYIFRFLSVCNFDVVFIFLLNISAESLKYLHTNFQRR